MSDSAIFVMSEERAALDQDLPVDAATAEAAVAIRPSGPVPSEYLYDHVGPDAVEIRDGLYRRFGKRCFDVVGGTILFLLLSPIMAVAWLAVKLTSPGPAILAQKRVGLNGDCVTIYKLRSMYVDHASRIDMEMIKRLEAQGQVYKSDRDPRVTPVGRIIRKTSIDEMPQLWNVIFGQMSLVGPRPLVPHMLELYDEVKRFRSLVRPGITGKWQVSDRENNGSVLGMIEHDFYYVENCSLGLDLLILLKTPLAVVSASGAQ